MWWRARMLGGRTNHYGRISLRMGPYDFKPYSRDGKGFDWPITYDDLAPYYDKAEELIGVFGTQEGLENTPDGRFQPAPAPRAHERVMKKVSDKLKIPCIPSRLAILTRPLNGRPACHYCAECGRACAVNANFASPGVHIAPALKTGNLEVRTGAMCREVTVGPDGRATRRLLYRYEDTPGSDGEGTGGGAGGELLRDRAHHAELQEPRVSERGRKFHAGWSANTSWIRWAHR